PGFLGSPPCRIPRQLSLPTTGRGCQLGTCQTHRLFSWLYHIGASDHKDDSQKDMADPMGYGRRRRWFTVSPEGVDLRLSHAALKQVYLAG
uniref:Uncharacterized protein n=1 Tax=Gopherus agassizii TaxID=38772 RepID=A0A452GKD3_9SAUR